MNDPQKFVKSSHGIQYVEIEALMEEFHEEIAKIKGKCFDIGCGPGNNSRNSILPKLSSDSTLVGLDISKNMIEYARKTNADEKRISFVVMNIETTNLQKEHMGIYEGAFSFFCIHWIQDLRRCYENIFKMLRPGGIVLNNMIVDTGIYSAYLKLAKNPRYKEYMKDVLKFISPLFFEKNPRAVLKKILLEVGFEVLHCSKRQKMAPSYGSEKARKDLLRAINPFVERMPERMQEEFIQDVVQETLKEDSTFIQASESLSQENNVFDLYTLLVVLVRKPEN